MSNFGGMVTSVALLDKNENRIDEAGFDGYISSIRVNGKTYKLRCEVVEVYPMTCPKCGGRVELHYGNGNCQSCGTAFTTQFKIVEG